MNALTISLQTYGTRPGCAILSISAVPFDLHTGIIGKHFFMPIDLDKSINLGFHIERQTIEWWQLQQKEFYEINHSGFLGPDQVLHTFNMWIEDTFKGQPFFVYGNSMRFDLGILQEAYNKLKIHYPFDYYWERDFRTLVHLADWSRKIRHSIPHENDPHPVSECVWQAKVIFHIIRHAEHALRVQPG